jgi:hypothetical protein
VADGGFRKSTLEHRALQVIQLSCRLLEAVLGSVVLVKFRVSGTAPKSVRDGQRQRVGVIVVGAGRVIDRDPPAGMIPPLQTAELPQELSWSAPNS